VALLLPHLYFWPCAHKRRQSDQSQVMLGGNAIVDLQHPGIPQRREWLGLRTML